MATLVGCLLILLVLVGLPLNELHRVNPGWFEQGTSLQQLGDKMCLYLGVAHGYLYMIFVLSAFILSRRAKWPVGFTVVTLLCGTIPIVSFWAEHRATKRVHAEFPETNPRAMQNA